MNILIVEDEFVSRKLLTLLLHNYGKCDIAVNGVEAVEAVKQSIRKNTPYDLICMDIIMPDMDGIEAIERIREFERSRNLWGSDGVKIIMTTGKDMPEDIFAAFKAGCEVYMIKPIERTKLLNEIRNLGLLAELPVVLDKSC